MLQVRSENSNKIKKQNKTRIALAHVVKVANTNSIHTSTQQDLCTVYAVW